jgi:hypothetical protein
VERIGAVEDLRPLGHRQRVVRGKQAAVGGVEPQRRAAVGQPFARALHPDRDRLARLAREREDADPGIGEARMRGGGRSRANRAAAASGPLFALGMAFAFASAPNGATTIAAKGLKIIIVPVTADSSSNGATTMPRSRCCITIAGRLSRLGQSRNLNVRRVRHHRIAPVTTNRSREPRHADHRLADIAAEEMVVEIEDPQLGPFPLALPARDHIARLIGIGAGALGQAQLVQPEAVAGIDDALRLGIVGQQLLGRRADRRGIGDQRVAGMRQQRASFPCGPGSRRSAP